jgi:hypothetical protein
MDQGADASGEDSGQRPGEQSPDGRWVTYDELGRIRGIGRESAVKLVQRKRWRRTRGNDGEARICVPPDWLTLAKSPTEETSPGHSPDHSPDTSPDIPRIMRALEATIAALTVRAERAEAEADRLIATVQTERERADKAEQGRDAERARTDALRDQVDGMQVQIVATREALTAEQAARTRAEGEAAALRQADQDRRRLGLLARIRAAVRRQ